VEEYVARLRPVHREVAAVLQIDREGVIDL
jgi:hypothetical protein